MSRDTHELMTQNPEYGLCGYRIDPHQCLRTLSGIHAAGKRELLFFKGFGCRLCILPPRPGRQSGYGVENLSSNSGLSIPQPQAPLAFAQGRRSQMARRECPGRQGEVPFGAECHIGAVAPSGPQAPGRRSWCAEAKRYAEVMAPATQCVIFDLSKVSLK